MQALIVTFFLIDRFGTPLATEENIKTVVGVVDYVKPKYSRHSSARIGLDGERYYFYGTDETIDSYSREELAERIHKGDTITIRYIYAFSVSQFPIPRKAIVEIHTPSGTYRTMEGFNAYTPQRIASSWQYLGMMEGFFLVAFGVFAFFQIRLFDAFKLTKSEKKKWKQFFKRR